MKKIVISLFSLALFASCAEDAKKVSNTTTVKENQNQNKVKTMENVQFKSNGVTLEGAIYYPENYNAEQQYPALIVTGAWTTVKEQMPSLYAKKLAEKGFLALVFDFRGWGASEGEDRYLEDPERKTADIVAAANYLRSRNDVGSNEVGGVGVCASSGYMVGAYSEKALDAVALVAPWLHNEAIATQVYGGADAVKNLLALSDAAQQNYETQGALQIITAASTTDENSLMYQAPYYTETDRGMIPAYDNKFNVASWRPWLTYDAIQYADKIPGNILFVESEAMALPQGSAAFKAIAGNKVSSVNLENVTQFDFYDRPEPVATAVGSVADFMSKELK